MADYRIPPTMLPALSVIAGADDDAVTELVRLLEQNPEVLISRQAAHDLAARLTRVPAEHAQAVTEASVALLYFKSSHGKSTREILKDIAPSLDKAKLGPDQIERLEKNLARILDLPKVVARAKAISIAADSPRLFSEARVVSDLRPIFGDRVTEAPIGAVVMHNLRINYAQEGEEREFFIHLDTRDLKTLQEHIARALEKDKTLRALLERTKLQIFETS